MTDDLGAAIEAGAAAIYEEPYAYCEACNGIGQDENAGYWCSACKGAGYTVDAEMVADAREIAEIDARAVLEAALPALLAAGWLPPEEAEALRRLLDRAATEAHEYCHSITDCPNETRADIAEARVAELESSWIPPERVEEIAALARQLGEALKRETAKQYREYQYVQVRDALDAYREALGSGKLRIVRAE